MKQLLLFSILVILLFNACTNNKTTTVELYNNAATLPDQLLRQIHDWKVISTAIDSKHKTMSILYGNEVAARKAASGSASYPAGADLCLVTWKQQNDQHWFGGRIPGNTQSVEWLRFRDNEPQPAYERYEGSPLQKSTSGNAAERVRYIVSRKALVIP